MNKRKLGSEYEMKAVKYLEGLGYNILHKNFRCKAGEIDIIGTDADNICFVEVKYRKNTNYGYPGEAVSNFKRYTIFKVARYYLKSNRFPEDTICRFDTVLILGSEIVLIKNAFGGFS